LRGKIGEGEGLNVDFFTTKGLKVQKKLYLCSLKFKMIIMEAVLEKRKIRSQRIIDGVSLLKRNQPEAPVSMEDMEYWQAIAKRLDNSVLANDITMQEIVDEVNAVRKERYEKQNCV